MQQNKNTQTLKLLCEGCTTRVSLPTKEYYSGFQRVEKKMLYDLFDLAFLWRGVFVGPIYLRIPKNTKGNPETVPGTFCVA